MVHLFCSFCGKHEGDSNSNTPMMRCKKCRAINYCSRECQLQHWKVHKGPCQISSQTNRDLVAQDSKRLVRLFISWTEIAPHPLDSLLEAHYGIFRLEDDICGKKVIEIETAFDYNMRTFVPTRPPRLLDLNSYRLAHPEHKHDLLKPEVIFMSLQLPDGAHAHIIRGARMFAFWLAFARKTVTSGPWDEIVEQAFPYSPPPPAALHSSIFRDDSWETIKQNNLETQCERVRQSPHYGQFIANALYIKTMQPRYKTHVIIVHVKLGMGLGQWSQLKDYHVLSLDEVMQLLQERRTRTTTSPSVTAFEHIERELLDLETQTTTATHPEATLARPLNDDDNPNQPNNTTTVTIRVPILFDVQVDDFVMMKPIFFRIPMDMSMMKSCRCVCDTKAREYFDELKETISFPTVVSPNLH